MKKTITGFTSKGWEKHRDFPLITKKKWFDDDIEVKATIEEVVSKKRSK